MLSAIANRTYDFVSNNMPSYQLASASQMAATIGRVALPIIVLAVSNQISYAEGGPMTCAGCYAACLALTWGGFSPMCAAVCAPICATPTP
ncbi:MAG: hypothetical protein K2X08_06180 [Chlamydiales bacterium]|nr:hypothetical protein [Chlamydiales bacterium]